MKKSILSIMALAAALCACNKEIETTPEAPAKEDGEALVFTATMEGAPESKATYDTQYKCAAWEDGDVISINGKNYWAESAGTTTTFKAIIEGATGTTYTAYFPASLYDGTSAAFPRVQAYKAGKFNMPMYASSTTRELEFKNLCAVLAIKVTSSDIDFLKSIKVSSDKQMNGSFTIKDGKAVLSGDGSNSVVLECRSPLKLTEDGTTFYIAIPAQSYKYLHIFLSSDGACYAQVMATKKASGLGELTRSQIFHIDYEKNATKLWDSDLFIADCNVGAQSADEYGGHYSWGGSIDKSNFDCNTDVWSLTGDSDTATKLWGSNWRMPTKEELELLLANCEKTGNSTSGYRFTGKKDSNYSGNSVFLPVAGYFLSYSVLTGQGAYWSSTPSEDNYAYCMAVDDGISVTCKASGSNKYAGSRQVAASVRAVLDTRSDMLEADGDMLDLIDGGNTDSWF